MKSGPTLNGAVRRPARRSAPIKPVATVVFPLPEAGAAMTTAGTLTPTPTPASVRVCRRHADRKPKFAHARRGRSRTNGRIRLPTSAGASVRKLPKTDGVSAADTHARAKASPLDALLALAADVHRVLDLRHLRDKVGRVE